MILNNTTTSSQDWQISNSQSLIRGVKSAESWGAVTPPAGPFNYTVIFGNFTASNIDNPDACVTLTTGGILVTYPGA